MKKLNVLLVFAFLLGACAVSAPEPTTTPVPPTPVPSPTPAVWDREGWNIAWHDEFDGPELNRENWNFDIGGNGWGNAEWEAYTDKPENIRIEDGMLVIEAREDPTLPGGRP